MRRAAPRQVVGLVRQIDVLRAYSQALTNRLANAEHRAVAARELRGTQVVQVPVAANGPLGGRSIAELRLPADTLVVAVGRGEETLIPRGDTTLEPGDRLDILVRGESVSELHEHLAQLAQASAAPS
jgi:Trk K+ transport system NAD-binding subunit